MPAPFSIDYCARDFETNLKALTDAVRARAPDKWNSFAKGDLGQILLEIISYDQTLLSYLVDAQAQECFLDTLLQRESLFHFAKLTAYQVRRATPATLQCYCRTAVTPQASDIAFVITKGTKLRSKDNQIWEVANDSSITPGNYTPLTIELQYGDVIGRIYNPDGTQTSTPALIKLAKGSAAAILTDVAGVRFASETNFGERVSQGSILVLKEQITGEGVFGDAPNAFLGEYAVVDTGNFPEDIYNHTVLYLDRPWTADDFIGKWRIENRNIELVQGEAKSETFSVPAEADTIGYSIQFSFYPVLSGAQTVPTPSGFFSSEPDVNSQGQLGITVSVNGERWNPTESMLFEAPDSNSFEYEFDSLDRLRITFGDGVFGRKLPAGAEVTVQYRVGGGASGNISQNSVDTTMTISVYGRPVTPITAYIANPYTIGSGGQDREDVRSAKRNIPLHVRSNDRAVTTEDYEYLASHYSDTRFGAIALARGVLHASMTPRERNLVWVYAWVRGANGQLAPPTYNLKGALYHYLDDRKMKTDEVVVVDGISTNIPLQVRYKFSPANEPASMLTQVRSALNGVLQRQTPGQSLRVSALYDAVKSVGGLEYVSIYSPMFDLQAENDFELFINTLQIPTRVKLYDIVYAGSTVVHLDDASAFSVSGLIGFFELGRQPYVDFVEQVDYNSNMVITRHELPDNYGLKAEVINSDFLVDGWSFERAVSIFVKFLSDDPTGEIQKAVYRAINQYFRMVLRPQGTLYRTELHERVSKVQDIFDVDVNLETPDGVLEQMTPGPFEIFVPGVISINGAVLAPIPEL